MIDIASLQLRKVTPKRELETFDISQAREKQVFYATKLIQDNDELKSIQSNISEIALVCTPLIEELNPIHAEILNLQNKKRLGAKQKERLGKLQKKLESISEQLGSFKYKSSILNIKLLEQLQMNDTFKSLQKEYLKVISTDDAYKTLSKLFKNLDMNIDELKELSTDEIIGLWDAFFLNTTKLLPNAAKEGIALYQSLA